MKGGSLTRYHTPLVSQGGKGLAKDLFKIAAPVVLDSASQTLEDLKAGKGIKQALASMAGRTATGMKRKLPDLMSTVGSHAAKKAKKVFKGRRVADIFRRRR